MFSGKNTVINKLAQGILGADVKEVVEFVNEIPRLVGFKKGGGGGKKGTVRRKPNVSKGPEALLVKINEGVKGVILSAVGVT